MGYNPLAGYSPRSHLPLVGAGGGHSSLYLVILGLLSSKSLFVFLPGPFQAAPSFFCLAQNSFKRRAATPTKCNTIYIFCFTSLSIGDDNPTKAKTFAGYAAPGTSEDIATVICNNAVCSVPIVIAIHNFFAFRCHFRRLPGVGGLVALSLNRLIVNRQLPPRTLAGVGFSNQPANNGGSVAGVR